MKRPRLIIAIISIIIEESAIALVCLWGLPSIGVIVSLWILVPIMLVWLAYSIYTFRKGTRALNIRQLIGLSNMVGTRGKTVSVLDPDGMVTIRGELWSARSVSGEIKPGSNIIVTGQQRLVLEVRRDTPGGDSEINH